MTKKHPIATIVNYCTNESRFLKECLEQVQKFSEQVIVPVCDHFFDGTPENRSLLESVYSAYPECQFVEYPFVPDRIPKKILKEVTPAHFWHSLSRLLGYQFLDEKIETVLFLDADEIPEAFRFSEWLDCSDYTLHTVLKFANYWYFREPKYRADKWEDSPVLVQKKALEPSILLQQDERGAIYSSLPGPKRRMVVGVDGNPMFHHFSWVRTEEEMLKKVQAWGHREDNDWCKLVKQEFSGPFKGTDFIHGYSYQSVDPVFDIHFGEPKFEPKGKSKVAKVTKDAVVSAAKSTQSPLWKSVLPSIFSKNDK